MIDGIDGLLGGLSIVSFAAIGILIVRDGQMDMAYWSFGFNCKRFYLIYY